LKLKEAPFHGHCSAPPIGAFYGLQKYSREESMTASKYLIEKIARHGAAAQRLINEQDQNRGEFLDHSDISATAFDAADFVWACFALRGDESVQESRYIRNHVAEAIIKALQDVLPLDAANERASVFENDGSPPGPNQSDGFQDLLDDGSRHSRQDGAIQIGVRDTGERTLLTLHVPEQLRDLFIKRLYGGSLPGEAWPVPITLELSPQLSWITDDKERAKASRRKEIVHLRIPLDEIHVNYSEA
jgi:hypothetical protein